MNRYLSWLRLRALIRKEFLQISRDPSSILIAVMLPLILLFIFGYGISLDARRMPLGVVVQDTVEDVRELIFALEASGFFQVETAQNVKELEDRLIAGKIRGILIIPEDHGSAARKAVNAPDIEIITDGSEPQIAAFVTQYVNGVLQVLNEQKRVVAGGGWPTNRLIENRFRYNPTAESRNFLVPGSIAVIMTIVGTLLTALVIAREWERGTMEALLASPISRLELILGKILPYFLLGFLSFLVCFAFATLWLKIPFRGSFLALSFVTSIFLLTALGIGLAISAKTKDQFVASQMALNVAFLPALILSGFVFEIQSMPGWIQAITRVVPARYYVSSLQTLFQAGDVWPVLLPNIGFLVITSFLFITAASKNIKRRLD
jgi:ABC-2 type transport system permease protein